jgi:hypothetical protein
MLMPIERIPDWERRLARQDAFWFGEIIDRPPVSMALSKPAPERPWPAEKDYPSPRERWLDTERMVEMALARADNLEYLGDALPHAYPNLGPEVFSAFFGCDLLFGEDTSWTVPCLHDWADVNQLRFDENNPYWKKLLEMTDALLAAGRGQFYTGMTDFHPGADAIAAFRDPLQLNIDMLEAREQVEALLPRVTAEYLRIYDFFYEKLTAAGQAICTWAGIVSTKKWLVPSNDFSCMISPALFDEVFLGSIAEECRHYEASLYHLDGPNALQHLDSLLSIPELRAIQWVYGAGNGRASDWLPVYRHIQAAGKGLQLGLDVSELDTFFDALHPEGVWLSVSGVRDREQAEEVLRRVAQWR